MDPFRFDPGDGSGKTYVFRRPSFADKTFAFRRAVHAAGGVYHSEFALLAAAEAGVRALLADAADAEERDAVLAKIARYRDLLRGAFNRRRAEQDMGDTVLPAKTPGELSEAERAAQRAAAMAMAEELQALADAADAIAEIGDTLRRGYPRYAAMEADRATYFRIRGLVACRMFLTQIQVDLLTGEAGEASPTPLPRQAGLVPDAALADIPPEHIEAIGVWCDALFAPGEARIKNSNSQSATPATPPIAKEPSTSLH